MAGLGKWPGFGRDRVLDGKTRAVTTVTVPHLSGPGSTGPPGKARPDGEGHGGTEANHDIGTAAELRILRPGFAAGQRTRPDLFVRMHVLRGVCGAEFEKCVPELRRRIRAAADPPSTGVASGVIGGEAAGVFDAETIELQRSGCRDVRGGGERGAARGTMIRTALGKSARIIMHRVTVWSRIRLLRSRFVAT